MELGDCQQLATSTPESVTPVPFGANIDSILEQSLPRLDGSDVLWWNGFAR